MTDLLVERVKSQITQFSGSSVFNWCFMIVANVRAQSSIGSKLAFVSPKRGWRTQNLTSQFGGSLRKKKKENPLQEAIARTRTYESCTWFLDHRRKGMHLYSWCIKTTSTMLCWAVACWFLLSLDRFKPSYTWGLCCCLFSWCWLGLLVLSVLYLKRSFPVCWYDQLSLSLCSCGHSKQCIGSHLVFTQVKLFATLPPTAAAWVPFISTSHSPGVTWRKHSNLKCQIQCHRNPCDSFHVSIWERARTKLSERRSKTWRVVGRTCYRPATPPLPPLYWWELRIGSSTIKPVENLFWLDLFRMDDFKLEI